MAEHGRYRMSAVIAGVLLFLGPAGAKEVSFDLEEVPVWELTEQETAFTSGQRAIDTDRPDPNVLAYPALKSNKPIYGYVQFGSYRQEKDPTLLYRFVIDESGGPGTGYDRWYVDLNGDKDLRNDPPVSPMKNPPRQLLQRWTSLEREVIFESVGIPLPFGVEGRRPLEVVPRLGLLKSGGTMLSFVPAKARRGRIEIAGRQYDVLLGHNYGVCGWLDHPETALFLTPRGGPKVQTTSLLETSLMIMRHLGETNYRFAATPAGDKLFVRPCEGPMGDFEVGGGAKFRTIDLTVSGYLRSRDTLVRISGPKCQLPAGDYSIWSMTIVHRNLTFMIQQNSFRDGGSKLYQSPTYPIRIRPDTPFVLDFSRRPQIVFAWPPKDLRTRPGERMFVQAVLVDPVLDFVVGGLNYGLPKEAPASGAKSVSSRDTNLPPQLTIARANGEIIERGSLDYG
jgi:hypothetical protein